ncbi:MAG: ABC transporter permease subunit [Streptococcaceae bacterium]|jgi:spermidine/putrescine transport system permease protein|nr:ABC transporter permease subunit [Streptococcaceae bacterium]MCH4177689.1 ABC transporter permease subunit [Streptococcaceae bacterium]
MEAEGQKGKLFKNIFIGLVCLFLYLPIVIVVIFSFNTSKMNILFEGFTTSWYGTMLDNRPLMEALWHSLYVGVVSTVIATIIGTLGAFALHKYQFPGKKLLDKILYIPIVIPEVVLGIALLSIFTVAKIQLSLNTLILSHITFCIPFVLITVRARLSGLDDALEEAALDLGASPFVAFYRITLPLIFPAIISGAMLAFTLSLDDVIISFFTTGPDSTTLPLKVLSMVKTGVTPEVNALSTVMMLIMVSVILFNAIFQVRQIKKMKNK